MRQDVKVTYFSDIIGRFDKQAGKIYGVSVITEGQAKGHDLVVDSQTLMEIKAAAESCPDGRLKTKLNHRSGVEAVFGYLENFRVDGPKLLADLKMLKAHKDFDQTFEQIEALPNQIGLSVAFVGKECMGENGKKMARCREILSADLVPEPAANPTGMFEAKLGALVDTEKIDNMSEPQNQPTDQPAGEDKEPTLSDVMNFLQEQILPRIEATEQFQEAIQAELDAAAADPDPNDPDPDADPNADPQAIDANGVAVTQVTPRSMFRPGDTGNQSHVSGQPGSTVAGNTNGGAPTSPSVAQPALAGSAEFQALQNSIVMLERKLADKDNQEKEVQFETAMGVIKDKTEAVIEYARGLENENATLLEALRTGARPVKNPQSEILFDTGTQTDFQSRVKAYVDAGKKKTEAVMLARNDDPSAHAVWLQSQGVVTHL